MPEKNDDIEDRIQELVERALKTQDRVQERHRKDWKLKAVSTVCLTLLAFGVMFVRAENFNWNEIEQGITVWLLFMVKDAIS